MRDSVDSESDREALSERSSSIIDSDQEQGQALLEKTDEDDVPLHRKSPAPRRLILLQVVGAVVVVVCLIATTYLFYSQGVKGSNHESDEAVSVQLQRSNDYILDSKWDFNASPSRREYHWTITDETANPDGVYRPMILINKQFPGPLIEVNEGDTIVVHVDNQASNATSIHWHGMYQKGTNAMDGTVGVTQCPIAPGSTFVYEFAVSEQSGTYWYHAHHAVQTSDGLFGPLIIHSKDERSLQKIDYATDRVVMIQDYYHDLSSELLMEYLGPDRENAEPVPDGALINGQNVRNCSTLPHRTCDSSNTVPAIFDLTPNENHRLRIINVGAFAEFQFEIDEHEFAVTEVDGTDVLPVSYHRLNFNPAQRYSIVISTNHTNLHSFWLRATMLTGCFAERNPDLEAEVRAIIRYQDPTPSPPSTTPAPTATPLQPTSKGWSDMMDLKCRDMNTSDLHPVIAIPAPTHIDAAFYLRANFEIGAHRLSRGFFNSSSFKPNPRSPILHRLIDGLTSSPRNSSFTTIDTHPSTSLIASTSTPIGLNIQAYDPRSELIIQAPFSTSTTSPPAIDLIITNFDDGAHPFHLHGHKFFLLGSGHAYPPSDLLSSTTDDPNHNTQQPRNPNDLHPTLSNPLRRDTATIEAYGWLHVRLVLDNPGVWLLHCHVAWHYEAGMGMAVVVGADQIVRDIESGDGGWMKQRRRGEEVCEREGIERGMRAGDEVWDGA